MAACLRLRRDDGFTLIELLLVVILIGILAAIALPTFLGQKPKAQDGRAKSELRSLVSYVEACKADNHDYTECDSPSELNGVPGLEWGTGGGQVHIQSATDDSYEAEGMSESGNLFRWKRPAAGSVERTCVVGAGDAGLCDGGKW
jgi:type IV pilus assembly protein PilA